MDIEQNYNLIPPEEYPSYDPTATSAQYAIREIAGVVPSTGEAITLRSWAIAFQQHPQSRARYRKIEAMLGDINENGYVPVKLSNVPGLMFASMSERKDLMGEFTTIWVTSMDRGSNARGGCLVCLNGCITHILATDIIEAEGNDRGIYLIEAIAERMATRAPEMLMANEVHKENLIERLPSLEDLSGLLNDPAIGLDTYVSALRNDPGATATPID